MSKRGRPKSFDPEAALACALAVFREKGYEGASLSDLTRAMGISRPALYDEFSSKEELFGRACNLYLQQVQAPKETAAIRDEVEQFLLDAATSCSNDQQAGCLLVVGGLAGADESAPVRRLLATARDRTVIEWRKKFEKARKQGDFPENTTPAAMARYVVTVAQGMSVQVRSGATATELKQVVAVAMRCWPKNDESIYPKRPSGARHSRSGSSM